MIRECTIPKSWVETGNTETVERLFSDSMAPAEARQLQGTIFFSFKELEQADEPLYKAPGFLPYVLTLHEKIPYLFYFLVSAPEAGAMEFFLRAHLNKGKPPEQETTAPITLSPDIMAAVVVHLDRAARFATNKGDDWRPIVTSLLSVFGKTAESVMTHIENLQRS